jgi:hypothetical protein
VLKKQQVVQGEKVGSSALFLDTIHLMISMQQRAKSGFARSNCGEANHRSY